MNGIKNNMEELVCKELQSANEKFPLFNSAHEAYAVILEEVEESEDALDKITDEIEEFWAAVKANKPMEHLTVPLEFVRKQAVQMAVEAIQIAAMCDKFMLSFVCDSMKEGGVMYDK